MSSPLPSHEPFRAEAQRGRIAISIEVRAVGDDWLVVLTGGEAHLGACALGVWDTASGRASGSVLTAPGHREEGVALAAARRLANAARGRVVVGAGIHYPGATRAEIDTAVSLCGELAAEAAEWIAGGGSAPSGGSPVSETA